MGALPHPVNIPKYDYYVSKILTFFFRWCVHTKGKHSKPTMEQMLYKPMMCTLPHADWRFAPCVGQRAHFHFFFKFISAEFIL
jgi:hypothetical protein